MESDALEIITWVLIVFTILATIAYILAFIGVIKAFDKFNEELEK